MSAPSGYTALDFVGFTDKGTYSTSATYMRNDLVHYGGNIMKCIVDNTTNVTPVAGANWELWVGASANLAERTIAPLENNPADVAYAVGRQIIYDDWLWEVIAPIAVGDALIDYAVDPTNANIKKSAPVETQLLALKDSLSTVATSGSYNDLSGKPTIPDELSDLTDDSTHRVVTDSQISTWNGKQDALTFDSAPTSGSDNPVKSGGVYSAVDAVSTALSSEASTRSSADTALGNRVTVIESNYQNVKLLHNIPRLVPKDITSYITDGTFYKRLNGTDGFELFEDLYVGDYIQMSRAISAYERTGQYQATGSQYVTIAGLDTRYGDGDGGGSVSVLNYHHAVMVPGQGFDGTQHFGRSRMNSSNDTTGGYVGSEMHTTTIGAVASSGSTASTASINQQLYAEFGSHLKTTRELLSNAMEGTRYNRFGQASGAASGWAWASCQAVLMSEVEVYGSIAWSSSGFDTGNANKQLPLFAHSKRAMNNRSAYYWLKDVASAAYFCACYNHGYARYDSASDAYFYVRPRFILA